MLFAQIVNAQSKMPNPAEDIKGTFKFEKNQKLISLFRVYTSHDGFFIDTLSNESDGLKNYDRREASKMQKKIIGSYIWDSINGKLKKAQGNTWIRFSNNYSFSITFGDGPYHRFTKKQSSLSSISTTNGDGVSHLLGDWNITAASRSLKIFASSDDKLILYDIRTNDIYELNRTKSVIEKYEGFSRNSNEEVLITVISNDQLSLDFGGNILKAQRIEISGQPKRVNVKGGSGLAAINEIDVNGNTKLHQAIYNGKQEDVEELISLGADINTKNNKGETALHEAVNKGDEALVTLLLDNKADINTKNKSGKSAFELAIQKWQPSNTSIVDAILEQNPKITTECLDQAFNQSNNKELIVTLVKAGASTEHAAEKAVQKNDLQLFQAIVDNAPGKVTITNRMFDTAVDSKNFMMADILISQGANPNHALTKAISSDISDLVYSVASAMPSSIKGGNTILEYAVSKRDTELASIAIQEHHADASKQFANAVGSDHLPMVELLMADGKVSPTEGLYAAVNKKNSQMLLFLLDKGADPNHTFAHTSGLGYDNLLKSMLKYKADPNKGVVAAAKNDHTSTLNILLNAGADANPLMPIAIEKENIAWVNLSLEKGAAGDKPSYINIASQKGNDEIVKILLKAGASPDDGILSAANNDHTNTVKTLLNAGADPNPVMLIAIEKEKSDWVKWCLENGAKGDKTAYIKTASKKGNLAIVSMLLDADANPDDGILIAIKGNFPSVVEKLVKAGADASPAELIKAAVSFNQPAIPKILLDAGADPNHGLSTAVNASANVVLQQLIDAGADAKKPSLLMISVKKGFNATTEVLLNLGLDANTLVDDNSGRYFIHHAAQSNNYGMVKVLVKKGAQVNIPTEDGKANTALHLVVVQGKKALNTAEALIKAGADVNAKNAEGKLILKVAKTIKMKKLLKKNGAKRK